MLYELVSIFIIFVFLNNNILTTILQVLNQQITPKTVYYIHIFRTCAFGLTELFLFKMSENIYRNIKLHQSSRSFGTVPLLAYKTNFTNLLIVMEELSLEIDFSR